MPTSPQQHRPAFAPSRQQAKKDSNKYYNKHVRTGGEIYHAKQWKELRAWYVKRHPLCVVCKAKGIAKAVEVVDHIKEIKDGGLKFCVTNLQSLCNLHHNQKSAHEATQRAV